MFYTSLLLAISVSIDALGMGITYGIRDTKVSNTSKIVLFVVSFIVGIISVYIGSLLNSLFPSLVAKIVGFIVLCTMGCWIIYTTLTPQKKKKEKEHKNKYDFFLKPLGITITIIRNPISSDLDNSNNITPKEAFYLAVALSLDVFSVGIGAGVSGVTSLYYPILAAIFQVSFVFFGTIFGKRLSNNSKIPEKFWNLMSAVILIAIGFSRILL